MNRHLAAVVTIVVCAGSLGCFGVAHAADSSVTDGQRNMERADDQGGVQALLGPGMGVPRIGPKASVLDYVRWADTALGAGNAAEAELSLEWAQARNRVDEVEAAYELGSAPQPYDDVCQRSLCQALQAIGRGDRLGGRQNVRLAIKELTAPSQNQEASSGAQFELASRR